MRAPDFARFIRYFTEQGGTVDARDEQGRCLMDIMKNHHRAAPFIAVLEAADAEISENAPQADANMQLRDGTTDA